MRLRLDLLAESIGLLTQLEERRHPQQVEPQRRRQDTLKPCGLAGSAGAEKKERPLRQPQAACIQRHQFYSKNDGEVYRPLKDLQLDLTARQALD